VPVLLWTDALIFLLMALAVGFGVYASRRDHLREPWGRVIRSRTGVITLVILSFFILVGLLDSVHYRPRLTSGEPEGTGVYSTEILSLLDAWLTPLRERQEKTYSEPFSSHLYAKERIDLPDGGTIRDYPRLRWGASHLADPQTQKGRDLALTALRGAVEALAVWVCVTGLLVWRLAHGATLGARQMLARIAGGATEIPWREGLITVAVVLVLVFVVGGLASKYHVLGTDKVGEDVLYQSLKSVRTGLVIGTLTTLVMLPAAIVLGIMAGYFRGWVDDVIQYLYTTLNSIPGVLLIAAAILMLQIYMANHQDDFNSLVERADLRLLFLCIILGVTSWTSLCRLLRGESLKLREMDFVQAATALGVSHTRVLVRHILPNVLHIVLITVVLDFSGLVLAEAVLSYVNIGVDPTTNSWGNMINSARLELAREPAVWWSLTAAFVFMFTLVLSANLFADVVRDAFDPRMRGQR